MTVGAKALGCGRCESGGNCELHESYSLMPNSMCGGVNARHMLSE